jgi:phosphoglucosamine mutase
LIEDVFIMSRELFGTDGVRGVAGEYPLDPEGTEQIGMAVGTHFAEEGETVLLGYDPRESSPELAKGLVTGIIATGANVEVVGVLPTPGLAYLTREGNVAAGVMVTASHNPYGDNGVKVFDRTGGKLPDETEVTLNGMIVDGVPSRGVPGMVTYNPDRLTAYEDFLVTSAEGMSFEGLTLGIDTAHGAASGIARRVFGDRLGATVVTMGDAPDGRNINDKVGATHTAALQRMVVDKQLDMGVALDGDADRLVMVDEKGREFTGDHILYTLGVFGGHEGIVATQMTNLGAEQAMAAKGITLVRADVGDRYVLEGLRQTGYGLGGEQSGHIVMPDLLMTGDGMLAAIRTIRAVRASGLSLAEWRDQVPLLPQSLVNIPVTNKELLRHPDVAAYVDEVTQGLNGSGRVLIRPSGTEPKARVMIEAPDAEQAAERAAAGLQRLLQRLA